jgi:hypothetical protein
MAYRHRYRTIALAWLILLGACSDTSVTTAAGNPKGQTAPQTEPPFTDRTVPSEPHPNGCAGQPSPYSVQPLYVIPQDGVDRQLHQNGLLAGSIQVIQAWFKSQTGSCLRFAHQDNVYTIGFARLDQTSAEINDAGTNIQSQIERALATQGFNDRRKIYAVYYDGASSFSSCGTGAWPPATPGRLSVVYIQGQPPGASPCAIFRFAAAGSVPGYMEFFMLHEILHTMGYAGQCAANHTLNGHVSDSTADIMWAGDGSWKPSALDVGRDDYFGHGRSDCPDLARSVFLDPLPASPEAPPRWPAPAS